MGEMSGVTGLDFKGIGNIGIFGAFSISRIKDDLKYARINRTMKQSLVSAWMTWSLNYFTY